MKIFTERLNELMNPIGAKKISQETLARELNVSQKCVSKWLNKEIDTDPTATNIANIAKYFRVTSDYLLGLSDDETRENINAANLFDEKPANGASNSNNNIKNINS